MVGKIEIVDVVINLPNRLYAGGYRKSPVDEIRHEEKADTIFNLD